MRDPQPQQRLTTRSASPLEAEIGFSRAVRIGPMIAVAGTAPLGPDGATVGLRDVFTQTQRCLAIAEAALVELGSSLKDVIRTRILLTDITTWREAARAHGQRFGEIKPVTTFVEVSRFIDPEWLVEIEVDAIVSHG